MSKNARKIVLSAGLLWALAPIAALSGPALAAQASASAGATSSAGTGGASATQQPTATATAEGVALATWFGPGLFGNRTACGQVLTRRLVGIANRKLPCGTLVRVAYRGHEVTVPVVDRGPYGPLHAGWDLTQAAAHMLEMPGTAKVEAKVVGHLQNSPQLGLPRARSSSHGGGTAATASAGPTGGAAAA